MPAFSGKSAARLAEVDPRLQEVFNEVIKHFDCTILEGLRSPERQAQLVADGKSKTLDSKHLKGLAVDAAPYPVDWNDRERFSYFAGFVVGIAASKGIALRWGGDWDNDRLLDDNTFDDLPHFELR